MKLSYRTVWISDMHLGSRGCQARDLARFLRCLECRKLYLVGDVIDFWRLRSRWFWPPEHHEVLQRLGAMLQRGTEIIYIPGNHDQATRQYAGLQLGGVSVRMMDVHHALDGRRLLVTHGDQYDLVVRHSRMLSMLGSAAYEWLLGVNRMYNTWRRWRGKPYWSLSKYLKHKVKSACTYISRFEEALIREAGHRDVHGVVCGHIHKAETATCAVTGIEYYNCGDWVESCTAVVEHHDGRMEVIEALPAIARAVRTARSQENDEATTVPMG